MMHPESRLQAQCVRYFRLQYPRLARLFFSVPNGGYRSRATAAIMKAEGTVAGVADLLLLYPSNGFHGLCVEMKAAGGRQQDTQKQWQADAEWAGYKYVVCRSLDEFADQVRDYLFKRLGEE